jgi:hypothetical protein
VASSRNIVSIASAPGWSALFEKPDDLSEEQQVVTLAAWALVEEREGDRRVVGLVQRGRKDGGDALGTLAFADEVDGFVGYAHRGVRLSPDS